MSDTIYSALAKAQAEMTNAPLNKINPHFKSRYADLAGIRDTVMPALTKHGLSVVQLIKRDEMGAYLQTVLMHTSGESIASEHPINADPSQPQKFGSALTYARRYSLSAMCCISADEDDDGNAAQDGQKQGQDAPKAQRAAAPKRDLSKPPEPPAEDETTKYIFGLAKAAAEHGTDALKKWHEQNKHAYPSANWWERNGEALKKIAAEADANTINAG